MSSQHDYQPGENGTIHNPLAVMQEGEKIIFEVRRHPMGLLFIYAIVGAIMIFFAILAFVMVPDMLGSSSGSGMAISSLFFLVASLATLAYVFIATIVYWGNSWVVSSDSLTQTVQQGLFRKKSAQLSLEHIEDVTADKHGFLPHLFNYGIVMVETAGEAGKFQFRYCPNPTFYAQKLLAAREDLQNKDHKASVVSTPRSNGPKPIGKLGKAALSGNSGRESQY